MAQSVSATFKIGYSAGYSAAAQAGRGAISPSTTERQDYEYDWRNFMAGWNAGCRDWANGKDPRPFGGKSRKAAAAKRSNAIPADAIQKMRELWGLLQNLHSVSEIAKMSMPDLEKRLDPIYGLALDIGHNTNTEDQAFLGAHRVITSIFEQMWYTVRNQHKGGFMSPLGNEAARLVVRAAGESQRRIAHEAQRFKVKASKSRKDAAKATPQDFASGMMWVQQRLDGQIYPTQSMAIPFKIRNDMATQILIELRHLMKEANGLQLPPRNKLQVTANVTEAYNTIVAALHLATTGYPDERGIIWLGLKPNQKQELADAAASLQRARAWLD